MKARRQKNSIFSLSKIKSNVYNLLSDWKTDVTKYLNHYIANNYHNLKIGDQEIKVIKKTFWQKIKERLFG